MKKGLRLFIALGVLLAAGWARAGGSFEGEVEMKMTHSGSDHASVLRYYVKGHKLRTEMEGKDEALGGGIYDWKTHRMIILMKEKKMYMVSQLHPGKFTDGKDRHFRMEKTGRTLRIAGYNCREWDYASDDNRGKVWFASGLGDWWGAQMAAQADKLSPAQKALVRTVVSRKLFPMKWESTDKSGNETGGAEVVRVERKHLPSSLFEAPAGYRKFEMPDFGAAGGGMNKEQLMKMMRQYQR